MSKRQITNEKLIALLVGLAIAAVAAVFSTPADSAELAPAVLLWS